MTQTATQQTAVVPAPRTAQEVPVGLSDEVAVRPAAVDRVLPVLRTGPVPQADTAGARRPATRLMLVVEVSAVLVAMGLAAIVSSLQPAVAVLVGLAVLTVTYLPGRDAVRPGLPTPGRVTRDMAIPFSMAGVACATGFLDQPDLAAVLAVVTAAGATTLVAAALRRRTVTGIRTVVVGRASDVAESFACWHDEPQVTLVGSLVIDEDCSTGAHRDRFEQAQDPRELIRALQPELVMVVPGPGVDGECIRRIGWALEGTGAGLVVRSDLEGIAPHRIQHTRFAGLGVMQVRSSRAPWLSRTLKAAADRLTALLLLVLLSPVLAVLVALIRATSPGDGVFKQVRVGKDGAPFTMYKLRTMRADAEVVKASLQDVDEGNGLLFKKREDPRVTRVGRVMRKYSLDEVPQLVNVLKGDMSLIGPRPALPEEVARYTSLERRRLAVRPGMTGAWQVSGRSTLGREESMRLDVDYTDNYRLVDDVLIAMRTVDAVVRPKGAW